MKVLACLTIYLHKETITTKTIHACVVVTFPPAIVLSLYNTHRPITVEVEAMQLIIEVIIIMSNERANVNTLTSLEVYWEELIVIISVDYDYYLLTY